MHAYDQDMHENHCYVVMTQVSVTTCVGGTLHVGPFVNITKHLALESLVG